MGTKIFALIVLVILAAFVVGLIVILGGLPGKIAAQRDHPNKDAIKIGGWATLIIAQLGWPFVLMWAYTTPAPLRVEQTDVAKLREEIAELRRKLKKAGADA